jgi:hypothetical protein
MRSPFVKLAWTLLAALAAVPLLARPALTAAQGAARAGAFVQRSGTELTLGGAPWRFIAYNDYQLTSLPGGYVCGRAATQSAIDEVMRNAAASGASAIRTWFFQSYYDVNAQGRWRAPSWAAFDRVLNAAARYGLKVIPVLVNEYQDCEPPSVTKNLGFFQSAYAQPGYGYPLSFKSYAVTVARHYANDPRIAFWQLGNELYDDTPSGCTALAESQGAHALRAFADAMTGALKAVDPNHLVSLGTQGSGQCGLAWSDYQSVMAGAVDLCEYHDYDDVTQPVPSDGYNRLAQRIEQCQALAKPLFIGESGIPADVEASGQATGPVTARSLRRRAGFYAAKIAAAFGAGVVGYALWDKEQSASDSSWNMQEDQGYDIGPNSLGYDPTNTVTADAAKTLRKPNGSVHAGFEDGGLDGFTVTAGSVGVRLGNSGVAAWAGGRSLALTLAPGSGGPQIATAAATGVGAGTTVTFHVDEPSTAGPGISVAPFVTDARGTETSAAATALARGWNIVTWTVPASFAGAAATLGLRVEGNPTAASALYVDQVAWTPAGALGVAVFAPPGGRAAAAPGSNGAAAPGSNGAAAPGSNGAAAPGSNGAAAPGSDGAAAPGSNGAAAPGAGGADRAAGAAAVPGAAGAHAAPSGSGAGRGHRRHGPRRRRARPLRGTDGRFH